MSVIFVDITPKIYLFRKNFCRRNKRQNSDNPNPFFAPRKFHFFVYKVRFLRNITKFYCQDLNYACDMLPTLLTPLLPIPSSHVSYSFLFLCRAKLLYDLALSVHALCPFVQWRALRGCLHSPLDLNFKGIVFPFFHPLNCSTPPL